MKKLCLSLIFLVACNQASFKKDEPGITDLACTVDGCHVVIPPVSPLCENPGQYTPEHPLYPNFIPLIQPTVPASCRAGFEMNNYEQDTVISGQARFSIQTNGGSALAQVQEAFVEYGTYVAPDSAHITAVNQSGQRTELFSSCLMRTWTESDPTGGVIRPPDITIRQWGILIPAGTVRLEFDFTGANTPTYMAIHGLCRFDIVAPSNLPDAAHRFRPFSSLNP